MIEQLALFPQENEEQKKSAIEIPDLATNWDDYFLNKDILASQSNSSSMAIFGDSLTVLRQIKSFTQLMLEKD